MKPKIITQIIVPGPIGGAEKVVLEGSKALIDQGIETSLYIIQETRLPHLALEFLELAKEKKIPVKLFSCKGKFDLSLLLQLKKNLKLDNVEIIHSHGFKAAFFINLIKNKNQFWVMTHHGNTSHTFKVKFYERLERQMMKRSDRVIVVSQAMYKDLKSIKKNIIKIDNFLSLPPHRNQKSKSQKLELLFVGRLSKEKGVDLLIHAISMLPQSYHFNLKIVGEGVERKNLEQLTHTLGLDLKIQFEGFKKDITDDLLQADVLVMPSLREGMPMTLIEALCFGLPILASATGGIPEIVHDHKNAILFSPGIPQEIQKSIVKFQQNQEYYLKTAKAYANEYRDQFSKENWVKKMHQVYYLSESCNSQL